MDPIPHAFPFGRPVPAPAQPVATDRDTLVIASVPAALSIRWRVPGGRLVQSLVVDGEPAPFWDGRDQDALVRSWREAVGWRDEWGAAAASRQNGQTGRWVAESVLHPLGIARERMAGATLLGTYHANEAARHRIDEHYRPLAERLGLPRCTLANQPGADGIVAAALADQRPRLDALLGSPSLRTVITLGIPSFRVLAGLAGGAAAAVSPTILGDGPAYGQEQRIEYHGRPLLWYAFVSPVAPGSLMKVHTAWAQLRGLRRQMMSGSFK